MAQKEKPQKEPGANKALINNALKAWSLPKIDIKDPNAVRQRIGEYLQNCAENDCIPSIPGCANWLGVCYETVRMWYTGQRSTPEHQKIMSDFYGLLQEIWAQEMHDGTIPGINGIFMSKVYFGYKDTQEVVVQHSSSEQLSIADLIADAKRLPGAETLSLPEGAETINAIDVEANVIDYDPRHERAVARYKKIEKRAAAVEANKPIRKARKKEYLKKYYQDHKAEKAAEKAQKELHAPDDQH